MPSNIIEEGVVAFTLESQKTVTLQQHPLPSGYKITFIAQSSGESSVAGLAALIEITKSPEIAEKIGLNSDSIILLFGTEGATDPEIYNSIIQAN